MVLPISRRKVLPNGAKNKLICENAFAEAKYGSCMLQLMAPAGRAIGVNLVQMEGRGKKEKPWRRGCRDQVNLRINYFWCKKIQLSEP